jgi:adenine phosphoribosyltransferase
VRKLGVKHIYINFLIELEELEGKEHFPAGVELNSIIKF